MGRNLRLRMAVGLALMLAAVRALAQSDGLSAVLILESDEVYLGEQFPVQIRVEGADRPGVPDLSAVEGFEIRSLGGAETSAELVSMVEGKVTRTTTRGYVFSYYFSAATAGSHLIPAITVEAGGRTVSTKARRVQVVQPDEGLDFRLLVGPTRSRVWVGEGFLLNLTWYIATPVRSAVFVVPFLSSPEFRFRAADVDATLGGKYAKATINGQETVVELDEAMLDGRPYTTVSWSTVVTPLVSGTWRVPASSVHFEARVERQRPRTLVESFFDTAATGDYRPFVVSSGETLLRVQSLPAQGRPARFAGHVGRYAVHAAVTPLEATVGDPITLTVTLSGPPNVGDAPAPDLRSQAVSRVFALSADAPQGLPLSTTTRNPEKPWVFTIRAPRAGVTEIPAIELPYFDPITGTYQVARSAPLPIRIVDARVVTSADAEGELSADATPASAAPPEDRGMAPSYETPRILRYQGRGLGNLTRKPLVLLPLLLSAAALLSSVALTRGRRLMELLRARRHDPLRACDHRLRALVSGGADSVEILGGILDAVVPYLAHRLARSAESLTTGEILAGLAKLGVQEGPLTELSDVFRICEAGRYAGYPLSRHTAVEAARRGLEACHAVELHLVRRPSRGSASILVILAASALIAPPADALDRRSALELLTRAAELARAASLTLPPDGEAARELYLRSAHLLEQLVSARPSGGLYYNLGNAYYGAGEPGRAILAWRRAQLLTPRDPNLRRNLDLARERLRGGADSGAPATRGGELVAPATRALLLALCASAAAALACAFLFLHRPWLARASWAAASVAVLLLVSLLVSGLVPLARRDGVITAALVTARQADGVVYPAAPGEPLGAGVEFRLLEERRGWYQVRLEDGRTGWIPAGTAELVVPR